MALAVQIGELDVTLTCRGAPWLDREALHEIGERTRRRIVQDLERLLAEALAGVEPDAVLGEVRVEVAVGDGMACPRLIGSIEVMHAAPVVVASNETFRSVRGQGAKPLAKHASFEPELSSSDVSLPAMLVVAPEEALLALLAQWLAEGRLAQRLALLPQRRVAALWRRLAAMFGITHMAKPQSAVRRQRSAASAESGTERRVAAERGAPFRDLAEAVSALVALAIRSRNGRPSADALAVIARRAAGLPVSAPGGAAPQPDAEEPAEQPLSDPRTEGEPAASVRAQPALHHALPSHTTIENALPFLMLGPLGRMGWLDAAWAALVDAGAIEAASLLGYALALKALPPPERGWRSDPAQLHAAAIAAGLAEPPTGEQLGQLERALGDALSLADGVLADALLRGHAPNAPLGVVVTARHVALVEPDGLFPLVIGESWADVIPVATAAGVSLLCGPQAANPDLLRGIAEVGLSFVAAGAPGRGEPWRAVMGAQGWRGMTNGPLRPRLIGAAQSWSENEEAVTALLTGFGDDRPIARCTGSLERSLTLAAMVALGDIAWRLGEARPDHWIAPDAALAFDRFADLGARVAIDRQRVELLLPLGPRARDLAGAGLCADVVGIPWLGGRLLRFAIG